jgi:hypothetical protein
MKRNILFLPITIVNLRLRSSRNDKELITSDRVFEIVDLFGEKEGTASAISGVGSGFTEPETHRKGGCESEELRDYATVINVSKRRVLNDRFEKISAWRVRPVASCGATPIQASLDPQAKNRHMGESTAFKPSSLRRRGRLLGDVPSRTSGESGNEGGEILRQMRAIR